MQLNEHSSDSELTLQLNGYPDADKFATFVSSSRSLVKALSSSVIPGYRRRVNRIRWYPRNASVNGAAIISYEAPNSSRESFERVEEAFFQVGNALRSGGDIPFSHSVAEHAERLRRIVDDDIESLVFLNEGHETIVRRDIVLSSAPPVVSAFDEVQGRIETISSRKGWRFILYDSYFDRAVTCYMGDVEDGQELTQYFGKMVRVMGLVTRDPETDRPFKVKSIRGIKPVEQPKYSWRDAKNSMQFSEELTPERYIRNLRDA